MQSRSLVPVPLDKRGEQLALTRPRLHQHRSEGCVAGPLQVEGRKTRFSLAQRTDSGNASVKRLVAEMKAEEGIDVLAKRESFFDTGVSSDPPAPLGFFAGTRQIR